MTVAPISGLGVGLSQAPPAKTGNFAGELGRAISEGLNSVNLLQHQADELALRLALGELEDLHQLTIAAEKAQVALQTAIQISRKVVEAYQETARMQL